MQAEVPPQMIEIDAVGAIAILHEKRSITPMSAASGHGPRSCASIIEASFTLALMCLKTFRFQPLAIALSNGMPRAWRTLWIPITPRPTERSRDPRYWAMAISSGAGGSEERRLGIECAWAGRS